VAYVVSQPTLIPPWPELDNFVRSIGPFLACAWCALERSRTASSPIAAEGLASQALDTLATLRVLHRVPIERSRLAARSLYEPLAWSYRSPWSSSDLNLEAALTRSLTQWSAECAPDVRRSLGVSIASTEARAYLANLLRKHRLEPQLGDRLQSVGSPEWHALSLGRKRYVLWASMRNSASEFIQSGLDEDAARRALDREIKRRCIWLAGRDQAGTLDLKDFCFLPGQGWRRPLILDVAMETFLPLGMSYWLEASSSWKL